MFSSHKCQTFRTSSETGPRELWSLAMVVPSARSPRSSRTLYKPQLARQPFFCPILSQGAVATLTSPMSGGSLLSCRWRLFRICLAPASLHVWDDSSTKMSHPPRFPPTKQHFRILPLHAHLFLIPPAPMYRCCPLSLSPECDVIPLHVPCRLLLQGCKPPGGRDRTGLTCVDSRPALRGAWHRP